MKAELYGEGGNSEAIRYKCGSIHRIAEDVFMFHTDCAHAYVGNYLLCRTDSGYSVRDTVTCYYHQYSW